MFTSKTILPKPVHKSTHTSSKTIQNNGHEAPNPITKTTNKPQITPNKNPYHQQNTTSDGQHPTQIVKHIPNQTPKIATSHHNSLYRQKTNSKLKHRQEPPMPLWSKIEG